MYGLMVDRESDTSLMQQLTAQIREKVLDGSMKSGERLPPSRSLAGELGIARNTVIQVYEQLIAEGYLESRTGSGTYVMDLAGCPACRMENKSAAEPAKWKRANTSDNTIRFNPGNPDALHFPVTSWAKYLKEACLGANSANFGYGPAAGEWKLRCALVQYLYRSKGISCRLSQIMIIPGMARGVELMARVLAGVGGVVAVEDPCIDFIQHILRLGGNLVHPVPVDRCGMMTDRLPEETDVRLIYTVPSHQFPTGAVMHISRRLQLLDYARRKDAYIIEDDYDSEYRYESGPIQSLRHLDPERVIYMGTFSKILSPALRLGYLIVPTHLSEWLSSAMEHVNLRSAVLEQTALAAFIGENLLDRHVYRMKKIYEKKRAHLIQTLRSAFPGNVTITGENAGLHVLAIFKGLDFQEADFEVFERHGVEADWAEEYAIVKDRYRNQLVLGYGGLSLEQISEGVKRLKAAVDEIRQGRTEEMAV